MAKIYQNDLAQVLVEKHGHVDLLPVLQYLAFECRAESLCYIHNLLVEMMLIRLSADDVSVMLKGPNVC